MRKRNPPQSPAKDFILRIQAAMINLILQDGTTVENLEHNLASKMQKVGEKLLAVDPSLQQSAMDMMNDPRLLTNPDAIIQEIIESYSEMVEKPAPAAPIGLAYNYFGASPLPIWAVDAPNVSLDEEYDEMGFEYEMGLGDFVPENTVGNTPLIDCFCPNLLNGHQNGCIFKG